MKIKILISSLILLASTSAYAADPFLSDSEEEGSYAEEIRKTKELATQSEQYTGALAELPNPEKSLSEQSDFRGTIDKLLSKAKPEPEEEKDAWKQFEDVEGTEAETKFLESSEYKIRTELSKPIQHKSSFSNSLEDIETSLGANSREATPPVEDKLDSFFNSNQ